jgi:enoyl-CoA hydratase
MMETPDDPYVTVNRVTRAGSTVVEIVLDRPEKLNALPGDSIETLAEVFESITTDSGAAAVLTGAGGEFCVGADVSEFDLESEDAFAASAAGTHRLVEAIQGCPLAVITRVNGRAFGIGFLLCMAADVVVAREDAEFGLQEVQLGIPVAGFATTMLPRVVGDHRAREWLFTGTPVAAEEAERTGFVTRIGTAETLDDAVDEYVTQFGSNSEAAIELLKSRMEIVPSIDDVEPIRDREREDIRRAFRDGDLRERIGDFRK